MTYTHTGKGCATQLNHRQYYKSDKDNEALSRKQIHLIEMINKYEARAFEPVQFKLNNEL
jgi:hypothetical protein